MSDDLYYLPQTGEDIDLISLAVFRMPSFTHKIMIAQNRIHGTTDQAEALTQAIYLILNTERYQYAIYSQRYGSELADLIGQEKDYAMSEIKRRIYEALIQDDRITDVDGWEFETGKRTVTVSFTVHSIYGEFEIIKEVEI